MTSQQEQSSRKLTVSMGSLTTGMRNAMEAVTELGPAPDLARRKKAAPQAVPIDSSGDENMVVDNVQPSQSTPKPS